MKMDVIEGLLAAKGKLTREEIKAALIEAHPEISGRDVDVALNALKSTGALDEDATAKFSLRAKSSGNRPS